MANQVPIFLAKIGRINFLARNGNNHQVIRMEIKSDVTITATDLEQIKNFCQDNLNAEAEVSAKQIGKTVIIGISKFQEKELNHLMDLIKK